jgi:hypothetical protein
MESPNSPLTYRLGNDAAERKAVPIYTAFIKYFPDAIIEVTKLSVKGNAQHNTPEKIWWDKSKSKDELDSLMRHLIEGDWAAVAWRAMANLQRECDKNSQKTAKK